MAGRMSSRDHVPVLLQESMYYLNPHPEEDFIDATVGQGGHAGRVLELSSPNGRLLGLDADKQAVDSARVRLRPFAGRVALVSTYFDRLAVTAQESGFDQVAGVLFDLGVSSTQLADPTRGLSFQSQGLLDMRLGTSAGRTAADLLATASREELARIFREFGEERYAGRIARRIVADRAVQPILRTDQLASLVGRTVPRQASGIHPATRVFQALRIAVNDELRRLRESLPQARSVLGAGGRLVVISFHSLEDRIVKQFFQLEAKGCVCPPGLPKCICGRTPTLTILTRKPIQPSDAEIVANPRSRSAKLRAAQAI